MDGEASGGSEARFAAYVEALGEVLGHADRQEPMRDYCLGLLMPIARKSVEPLAATWREAAPIGSLRAWHGKGCDRRIARIVCPSDEFWLSWLNHFRS